MTLSDWIKAAREKMEKAKALPWEFLVGEPYRHEHVGSIRTLGTQEDKGRVCDFGDAAQYYPSEGVPPNEADLAYLLHAVNNLPALLDALEAGEKMRGFAGKWQHDYCEASDSCEAWDAAMARLTEGTSER